MQEKFSPTIIERSSSNLNLGSGERLVFVGSDPLRHSKNGVMISEVCLSSNTNNCKICVIKNFCPSN
ncbi:hypothetical protein A2422_04550 [Candidatus Woesebacteria bacterium RIFOXYC1_FULL_31_51]|uniref:Uncharacterized protein n=1 Tax=Candidatus Woesebacteria bacterium GW2011_GWC2_31_9 TaxID=1618586 RepID=A0A0G0AZK4_9BACT|nr:MAG: hypothetical protein UR17_C0001G0276 [Candidatus Woesebacteria bacterium GW2011_GWF1_31_35]KKP23229.1 MAG: hypothetical protein UR11_C0001G0203 [Candidatus Woesebacteria bacterium GW2011_GWC1_30_29]KKP25520.1 MAG: hypothetical protein UR13_C0008G0036 [Candidatus Woesebacteria bacterium GW2011_GWD1_31_12]KKP27491.1 MAG: hypothetical protein UR16_C0003G0151 [Candidatus Woesebacteria bacterium GW2011_GWB1_31_29]KKP31990.1 MAG: hypothetical protein UR21_C0003G0023 [Candidatus Woesebacteria 